MDSPQAPSQAPIEAALRAVAERQRRELGAHLETDELVAYQEGMLPEEPAERARDHLARCPECAGRLLDLDALYDASPAGPPEAAAEAEAAWRELAPRLGEERATVVPLQRQTVTSTSTWRALAAIFFLGVIGLSTWMVLPRHDVREPAPLRPGTLVDLWPEGNGTRGTSEIPRHELSGLVIHLTGETASISDFEADILAPDGSVKGKVVGLHPNSDRNKILLILEAESLKTSGYTLRLYGLRGGERQFLAAYPLP